MTHFSVLKSPLGELTLVATQQALVAICWDDARADGIRERLKKANKHPLLAEAGHQLRQYFDHKLTQFDLPLSPMGTAFQLKVWQQLQAIPYGQTRSYGELARSIGQDKACRAVGMANKRNPISIVIPCHRVIGADGTLTGFGGGMQAKRFLLELELQLA